MRVYLKCTFQEKEKVKSLGARWDYERRSWFIDNPENIEDFAQWIEIKEPQIQSRGHKKIQARSFGTSGDLAESCDCDVLPWEDCKHTA